MVALWFFRAVALLVISVRCGARRISMAILSLCGATQTGSGYPARVILSSIQRSRAVFADANSHPRYCETFLNGKFDPLAVARPKKSAAALLS